MPRAHRYFLPDHVWHITQRCHQREFLLKFAHDRKRWIHWLFEATQRFGLSVLDYVVTSNHIHLLVHDQGRGEIVQSMQLIAGCTAQEYNRRKARTGAFWQDRYHATAVEAETHLARCITYIDLNMVRAGVVRHPREWAAGGYREIQSPPKRYAIVNHQALLNLLGMSRRTDLQKAHAHWVAEALRADGSLHDPSWTQSIAVGQHGFVEAVQSALGIKARYRKISDDGDAHSLQEPSVSYAVNGDGKIPV